ncbi:MAG: patatin-like phospholipase family protein [Brachymonas denitrificans]|uniref:patatin-like phospholipase family protein n=2 Tax=Brachymonas denitrificans TaxID=28220 RepID=UPI00352EDA9C
MPCPIQNPSVFTAMSPSEVPSADSLHLHLQRRQALRLLGGSMGAATLLGLTACGSAPPAPSPQKPAAPPVARRKPRLALALGGGAARGFAHVGALEVLEEAGIRPDIVVGTSAGSVVGSIYASGLRGRALRDAAQALDKNAITDWQVPFLNRGLLRGAALERFINQQVGNRPIQAMPVKLGIVATDLKSGQGILFRSGNTGQAVRASSAVPGVFEPVRIGSREYVDGGLVAPVPVNYARQLGGEVVVAIDISSEPTAEAASSQAQVVLKTFSIMGRNINTNELKNADVVLRPALAGVSSADFSNRERSIEAGRAAMRQALPRIRALLAKGV